MTRAFITALFILFITNTAFAFDFYGANVTDKEAPSSYLRVGITGYRPIITELLPGTHAYKIGFKIGDIIISVNDKQIKKTSELISISGDVLNVVIFRGNERKTLSIDRVLFEAEKAARKEAELKEVSARQVVKNDVVQNDPSVLKLDNKTLENKFGKSKPTKTEQNIQRTNTSQQSSSSNSVWTIYTGDLVYSNSNCRQSGSCYSCYSGPYGHCY